MGVFGKMDIGMLGIVQPETHFLRGLMMKKLLILMMLVLISGCQKHAFEAGYVKKERKELYEYNNNEEYCKANPDRCINNVPW